MPSVSRFFLKTGFIWLVVSMLLYGLQAMDPGFQVAYHHSLGLGWVTQIIMGVAAWMFPRWSKEHPKGPMWIWWTVYYSLNIGLIIRLVSEYYLAQNHSIMAPLLVISGFMLWLAIAGFVIIMWRRVKAKFS